MACVYLAQITVDGDTSTNDTVIGLASGKSGAPVITDAASADGQTLEAAVTALLQVILSSSFGMSQRPLHSNPGASARSFQIVGIVVHTTAAVCPWPLPA